MEPQPPRLTYRLLALTFGPIYLIMLAVSFSRTSGSFVATLIALLAGAAVIMAVLIAFGVKAYRHAGDGLRFNLSTVLLFIVPLCVYLAALRHLLDGAPTEQFSLAVWLAVVAGWLALVLLSTAILIYFTEALMWLVLSIRRWRAPGRHG